MAASADFNSQFIMLRFRDLDDSRFMQFVASPAFATYLVMRRHIWRSTKEHYMGLHDLYRDNKLACSLERTSIGERLGGASDRKISYDIDFLGKLGIIRTIRTGRQSIYVLGEWGEKERAYYEVWYLDSIGIHNVDNSNGSGAGSSIPDMQGIALQT